jgi:two-component system CheB/CheR fusion protein
LQQRVIATFHYALLPGRPLFLGPAEGVASQPHLFAPIDKRHRLYARQGAAASVPAFSLPRPADHAQAARPVARPAAGDLDRRVARAVARYAPTFLVVNRQHDILRFSGRVARFLEPSAGAASLGLFALLHTDLRAAARAALKEAAATGERVVHAALLVGSGGRDEAVNLVVEPLRGDGEESLFVVVFQEAGPVLPVVGGMEALAAHDGGTSVELLKREILETKERLRNVTEELEAANEELQSSNEEYLSVNEELQSANEELETSKEELQSLNEELQTINAELNSRNDSLLRSNSDLANLLDSTSIATLFLDRDLRTRRFTPRLLDIFNVRAGDEGRPISDIVTHLTRDGLGQDVQQVLLTQIPREREVAVAAGGTSYLMQVRPYRDVNGGTDGAVVSFVDVSDRKRHEQARSTLGAIVESSQDAIIGHDLDGRVTSWNGGAERLLGTRAQDAVGQPMPTRLRSALRWEWQQMLEMLRNGERLPTMECAGASDTGRPVEASVTISPVREGDGHIVGVSVLARDIAERKAAERNAALLLGELDHRVKNILAIVTAVISQTLKTATSPEAFADEVGGRVQAIAKAHSLLTQSGHGEVSLSAILRTELAPYDHGAGNVSVAGPNIALTPKAGLALAMAIHELASNAAKYGALSTTAGQLTVAWDILPRADVPLLALTWAEEGGPAVSPPTRRGFGTTLIERALAHQLDAEVSREFLTGGLRCTIAIPLSEEVGRLLPADTAGEAT